MRNLAQKMKFSIKDFFIFCAVERKNLLRMDLPIRSNIAAIVNTINKTFKNIPLPVKKKKKKKKNVF